MSDPSAEVTTFGRFQLEKKLLISGSLEVDLASTGSPTPSKVVLWRIREPASDSRTQACLRGIEEAGGALLHPNILEVLEAGEIAGHYFLAVEHVPGASLDTVLEQRKGGGKPVPPAAALEIVRQLCSALDYGHSALDDQGWSLELVHRWLWPGNIVLTGEGRVKLAGLGAMGTAPDASGEGFWLQAGDAVAYMAPEVVRGEKAGPSSDLFSLGAVLFELLTLETLYPGLVGRERLEAVKKAEVDERLALLEPYPIDLVAVIARLLAPDPAQRYTSALEVDKALSDIAPLFAGERSALVEMLRKAGTALGEEPLVAIVPGIFREGASSPVSSIPPLGEVSSSSSTGTSTNAVTSSSVGTSTNEVAQAEVEQARVEQAEVEQIEVAPQAPELGNLEHGSPSDDESEAPKLEDPDASIVSRPEARERFLTEAEETSPSEATEVSLSEAEADAEDVPPSDRPSAEMGHLSVLPEGSATRGGIVSWPASPDKHPVWAVERQEDRWKEVVARADPEQQDGTEMPSVQTDLKRFKRRRRRRWMFAVALLAIGWISLVVYGRTRPEGVALMRYLAHRVEQLRSPAREEAPLLGFPDSATSERVEVPTPWPPEHDSASGRTDTGPVGAPAPETPAADSASADAPQLIVPEEHNPTNPGGGAGNGAGSASTDMSEKGQPGAQPSVGDSTSEQTPEQLAADRALKNKAVGYLFLQTVPPTDVYVDGVKLPVRTPIKGYPVAKGRRKLVVKTAEGETRGPFTIIIKAGQKKYVNTIVIKKKTSPATP